LTTGIKSEKLSRNPHHSAALSIPYKLYVSAFKVLSMSKTFPPKFYILTKTLIKIKEIVHTNQPTRCNNFSSLLLDVYLHLNKFRASPRPSSGAQQLQQQPLVQPLERGDTSAVGRGRAGRPDHEQQHCCHHDPKVKPEAATSVVELLMMG
jgi:hypothetical protein